MSLELKKGIFLIATPDIEEGLFHRSVVLLCEHSPMGSLGLIINQPLEPDPEEQPFELGNGIEMRSSGPNQTDQIMLIQNKPCNEESSLEICPGVYLNGDPEEIEEGQEIPLTLLCFGYGGWASGVLEQECLKNAWILSPATSRHVFETPPDKLWQTLLRELGGEHTILSLLPENLDLN